MLTFPVLTQVTKVWLVALTSVTDWNIVTSADAFPAVETRRRCTSGTFLWLLHEKKKQTKNGALSNVVLTS